MLPFFKHADSDSLLHNISFTSRGPVHHEKRITKKKKGGREFCQGLSNPALSFYKIQMSLSARAEPSGDSSSSLLSSPDYPPVLPSPPHHTLPFHLPPPPLRNHKLRGSWWNPKHEALTGLSNPCLDLRGSSLLTVPHTSSPHWFLFLFFFFLKSNFKCLQLCHRTS